MRVVLCGALAVICLLVRVELSSGQCPPDFIFRGNKCYKFSTANAARDQAAATCSAMGAQLLSPQDSFQQSAAVELLSFQQPTWEYTWTSLRQSRTDWRWSFSNQPFDTAECFTKESASRVLFELSFRPTQNFTLPSCKAACKGWIQDSLTMAAVTIKSCNNQGAACLHGEQAACYCSVSDITKMQTTPTHCNSTCPGDPNAKCGTTNAFYATIPSGAGWYPGQPDMKNGNELCLGLGFGFQYQWIAKSCSTPMRYACQYNTISRSKCQGNGNTWLTTHNLCFKVSTEAYNWYQARQLCKADNGELLVPLTDEAFRLKLNYLVQKYNGTRKYVASDLWTDGISCELLWGDGMYVGYTNFAELRPDISLGSCVALSKRSTPSSYMWDSRPCQEEWPYICETASAIKTNATTSTRANATATATNATTTTTATSTSTTTVNTPSTTIKGKASTSRSNSLLDKVKPGAGSAGSDKDMQASQMSPQPNSTDVTTPSTTTASDKVAPAGGANKPPTTTESVKEETVAAYSKLLDFSVGSKIAVGVTVFAVILCVALIIIFSMQRKKKEVVEFNQPLNEPLNA